jgi:DNA-binding NarL/FixJ family response regulator
MTATAIADPASALGEPPRRRLRLVRNDSSPTLTARVAIACGSTLVRAAFRALLEGQQDVAVSGEAGSGEEALELVRRTRPDVVLISLALPGLDPLEVIRQITAGPHGSGVQVMVLSSTDGDDLAFTALRAGASGFVRDDDDPEALVRAVRALACGDALLSSGVTRRLIAELTAQPTTVPNPEQLDELTAREREVMALAAGGLNNDEIGERLVVSPATAKTHVSRAMMKLHARDRAQLVALAYKTGLVHPRRRLPIVSAPVLAAA